MCMYTICLLRMQACTIHSEFYFQLFNDTVCEYICMHLKNVYVWCKECVYMHVKNACLHNCMEIYSEFTFSFSKAQVCEYMCILCKECVCMHVKNVYVCMSRMHISTGEWRFIPNFTFSFSATLFFYVWAFVVLCVNMWTCIPMSAMWEYPSQIYMHDYIHTCIRTHCINMYRMFKYSIYIPQIQYIHTLIHVQAYPHTMFRYSTCIALQISWMYSSRIQ